MLPMDGLTLAGLVLTVVFVSAIVLAILAALDSFINGSEPDDGRLCLFDEGSDEDEDI